jgi:thiol-disulfide isomerase/thioredoxin
MKKLIAVGIPMVFVLVMAGIFSGAQDIPRIRIADLKKMLQQHDAVYVINFWATWCEPCREEIPNLLNLSKAYADSNVKIIMVSLDYSNAYPGGIREFIQQHDLHVPVFWLDETSARAIAAAVFPQWKGLIPFTIFLNRAKGYEHIIEQEIPADRWVPELRKAL